MGLEYAGETKSGIDTGFEVIKDPHFMHLKYLYIFYSNHLNRNKFLRTMSPSMILNVHVNVMFIFNCFCFSPNKVGELTEQMVGYNLITKQTPEDGVLVNKVNELNKIFVFLRFFKQSSQSRLV